MSEPITPDEYEYLRQCVGAGQYPADRVDKHINQAVAIWDNYWGPYRKRDLSRIGHYAWMDIQHRLDPYAMPPQASLIYGKR